MISNPVFIVGAPRSGTSLLQKILRECPGFGSVPREAQHIWGPHVHPSRFDWHCENAPESILRDEQLLDEIRQQFGESAVSAESWRKMSGSWVTRNPLLRRVARIFPRQVVSGLIKRGATHAHDFRLVEKSVHAGLWLPLVDAVFPDARYLHIVRDPGKAIPSIESGWREADRFFSFELQSPFSISDLNDATRDWCFPLPAGWRDFDGRPTQHIAAFQWRAINQSIFEHFATEGNRGRCLVVKLEDLIAKPAETLRRIRVHSGIPEDQYFDAFADGLPVVNRGPANRQSGDLSADLWSTVADVAARLGYPRP